MWTELSIAFESDWRIGTGSGTAGAVDDLVHKNADGLPVVPATTVTGMLRDGAERVAGALGGGWPGWVDTLFGTDPTSGRHAGHAPQPAALAVRAAGLDPALAVHLRTRSRLRAALFDVRPGVALEPGTKQAIQDCLRMIEVTRGGLVLRGDVELDDTGWTDEQRGSAWILLALGASETRALGGGRRRGLGRCTVEFVNLPPVALALLSANTPPKAAPLPLPRPPAPRNQPSVPAAARWVSIELDVTCVDPVVSAAVATDGTVRGETTVPGGRVLPVVIARALGAGVDLEPLINDSALECHPLVPRIDGGPAWPAPRCLVAPKGRQSTDMVWNLLRQPPPAGVTCKPPHELWVAPAHPAGTLAVTRGVLRVRVHNTIRDSVQRPTEDVGGLYSYEAIPAGTRLHGSVRLRIDRGTAQRVATALNGRWRLGRSKKDDYGRVEITARLADDKPAREHAERDTATVWFRTDAVLLDETLRPVSTVDGVLAVIGERLGVDVRLAKVGDGCQAQAVSFRRLEGWHTRWVRPRPTLLAVAAGSVLLVSRADGGTFPAASLVAMERAGLGERRAEGLGLVAVDHPILATGSHNTEHASAGPRGAELPGELDADGQVLVRELGRIALRREIEGRAALIDRSALGELGTVPPNQLGQVRRALAAIPDAPDPETARAELLGSLGSARTRAARWPAEAAGALRALLQPGAVFTLLGIPEQDRVPEVEDWARSRLLAHLTAGGSVARVTGGGSGGA